MSWYCPLPFTSISSNTSGYYALCCESRPSPYHCSKMTLSEFTNTDYMKKIKEGFKSDDPLSVPEIYSACLQCKTKENHGSISKRQREIKNYNVDAAYRKHFLEFKLIGNICNYACIMCSAKASSKIAEEQGINIPKYFNLSDEWYDDLKEISKDFDYFKFSGGEPFMSPTTDKIIKVLIETGRADEITLQFNTNGSVSKKVIEKYLNTFKEVHIIFSIDAWGERNSVIRKHSTWEFTEDRLWDYSTLTQTYENMVLRINPCISILNIGYLNEFEPYLKEFDFLDNVTFGVSNTLAGPKHFCSAYLPYDIKKMYLEKNYDFLTSEYCKNTSQAIIGILNMDYKKLQTNLSLDFFQKGIRKIPNVETWYPEFLPYKV